MIILKSYLLILALLIVATLVSAFTTTATTKKLPSPYNRYPHQQAVTRVLDKTLTHTQSQVLLNAGPAILEPPTKETVEEKVEKKEDNKERQSNHKKGGWAVRLFNDPFNKREFVSMILCKICGLSNGQSYQVMMQAHQNGVAIVGRYDFERAELYKTALLENGLSCDMIPVDED